MELRLVGDAVEVEGLTRAEYNNLFGKVAVIGIIQTV